MSRRSCSVLGYPTGPVRNGQTAPLFASCQCSGTVFSISAHSTQSADSSFRRSGLAARFTLYCTQPFIKRHCKLQIPKIRRKAKSLLGFPAFPHLYHTLYKQVKNHDPIYFSLSLRRRFVGRTARTEKQKKMQRDAPKRRQRRLAYTVLWIAYIILSIQSIYNTKFPSFSDRNSLMLPCGIVSHPCKKSGR